MHIGHPEEVLAATLATAAVLAAIRGRNGLTWLLLGLAVGTKQWALLAAPCVLLALPERRIATAVKAGALALALSATLPLARPGAFAQADSAVGGIGFTDPFSLWWPVGPRSIPAHAAFAPTAHLLPFGITRSVAAAFGLVSRFGALWLYWSRSSDGPPSQPAGAAGVLRPGPLSDRPDPLQYNFVALLIPLAAWEAVELGRLPVSPPWPWAPGAARPRVGRAGRGRRRPSHAGAPQRPLDRLGTAPRLLSGSRVSCTPAPSARGLTSRSITPAALRQGA